MSRILVVEDNEDLAFGLRTVLEFEGYEVEVATEGESALTSLERGLPDLMILDIMLPGRSGFDILREMRSSGKRRPRRSSPPATRSPTSSWDSTSVQTTM